MTTKPVTDAEKAWRQHLDKANRESWNAVTFDPQHMNKIVGELDRLRAQSREAEAVGAVPVTGIFHARSNPPEEDWIEWPEGYEPVDGMTLYTAPPSTAPKAQDDLAVVQMPEGWAFSSADFFINCLDFMRPGSVMLKRVGRNRSAWFAMSEEERGEAPLFVIGSGFTVQEAIANAVANIAVTKKMEGEK